MPRLCETQRAFAEAVTEGRHHAVATMIAPEASALRSIALYRRLIRNNYRQVLKITYPVLHRFVGEQYFVIVARGYIRRHPSTSGDLFPYGCHLSAFLHELQVSPLLVELARLEWACHEVHQAADSTPVSQEQVQAIASVNLSRVTAHCHPATRLLVFPVPVHRVWSALQPDASGDEVVELPLPEEETAVLVKRLHGKVQVTSLPKCDSLLLEALMNGADVASVERMAVGSDPGFDLSRFLAELLKQHIVAGFSAGGAS